MKFKICSLLIATGVVFCIDQNSETSTVNIEGLGLVRGSISHTAWSKRKVFKFQGLHYGVAPVENLRFQPTVKVAPWDGVRNATEPGVRCPQITKGYVNVDDEDCLTLSVFTNELQASRPVMVFIHGGWFYTGGADEFQPDYLLESDIVLVTVQYRLGPLGFLSTMSDAIPGNVGMLDVITALEWVQQHIASFGGNSSMVTIFGQSAGASSVSAMLHSPLVQNREVPLFRRAILQSGSLLVPRHVADDPVEGAKDIAKRLGCGESEIEMCFRAAPTNKLLEAFLEHRAETIRSQGFPSVAAANLVIGGPTGLFPHHPKYYMRNVNKKVQVMAGTVSDDGLYLLYEINRFQSDLPKSLNSTGQVLDYMRTLYEKFGQSRLDGVLESYALSRHFNYRDFVDMQWKNLVTSFADASAIIDLPNIWPVVTEAREISHMNPGNVYLYSFDFSGSQTPESSHDMFPYEGPVNHTDELNYLFPLKKMNSDDVKMAKTMVQLWTSFASEGVPRAKDVPTWHPMG
ncbi:AAEL000862-PA, partial [Aedes aegypti]